MGGGRPRPRGGRTVVTPGKGGGIRLINNTTGFPLMNNSGVPHGHSPPLPILNSGHAGRVMNAKPNSGVGPVVFGSGTPPSRSEESETELQRKYEAARAMFDLASGLFEVPESLPPPPCTHTIIINNNGGGTLLDTGPSTASIISPTGPGSTQTPPRPAERGFPCLTTTTDSHSHLSRHHQGGAVIGVGGSPIPETSPTGLHHQGRPGSQGPTGSLPAVVEGRKKRSKGLVVVANSALSTGGTRSPTAPETTGDTATVTWSQRHVTSSHDVRTDDSEDPQGVVGPCVDNKAPLQYMFYNRRQFNNSVSAICHHSGKSPSPPPAHYTPPPPSPHTKVPSECAAPPVLVLSPSVGSGNYILCSNHSRPPQGGIGIGPETVSRARSTQAVGKPLNVSRNLYSGIGTIGAIAGRSNEIYNDATTPGDGDLELATRPVHSDSMCASHPSEGGGMTLKRPLVVAPSGGLNRNFDDVEGGAGTVHGSMAENLCLRDVVSIVTSVDVKDIPKSLPLKKRKYVSMELNDVVASPNDIASHHEQQEDVHLPNKPVITHYPDPSWEVKREVQIEHGQQGATGFIISQNTHVLQAEREALHSVYPLDFSTTTSNFSRQKTMPIIGIPATTRVENWMNSDRLSGNRLSIDRISNDRLINERRMSNLSQIVHKLSAQHHKESSSREFDLQLKKMAHAAFVSSSPPHRRTAPNIIKQPPHVKQLNMIQPDMMKQLRKIQPWSIHPDAKHLDQKQPQPILVPHDAKQPLDLTRKKSLSPQPTFSPNNEPLQPHQRQYGGFEVQHHHRRPHIQGAHPRVLNIKTEEGASVPVHCHGRERSPLATSIVKTEGGGIPCVVGCLSEGSGVKGSSCGTRGVKPQSHSQREAASPAQAEGKTDGAGAAEPKPVAPRSPSPLLSNPQQSPHLRQEYKLAIKPDEDGDLPIHIAVVQGNGEAVDKLLYMMRMSSVTVDFCNNIRQTPLHLAIITKECDIVRTLLINGASSNFPDRRGNSSPHLAIQYDSIECLSALTQHSQSKPNLNLKNYDGLTPLHLAVQKGNAEFVKFLLCARASVDITDGKSGRTPLLHATESRQIDMVELLLSHCAKVNVQSYAGNTALHAASERNYKDIMALLVRYGADTTIKNANHETYNSVAKDSKNNAYVKVAPVSAGLLTPTNRMPRTNVVAGGSPPPSRKTGQKRTRTPRLQIANLKQEHPSPHSPSSPTVRFDHRQCPSLRQQGVYIPGDNQRRYILMPQGSDDRSPTMNQPQGVSSTIGKEQHVNSPPSPGALPSPQIQSPKSSESRGDVVNVRSLLPGGDVTLNHSISPRSVSTDSETLSDTDGIDKYIACDAEETVANMCPPPVQSPVIPATVGSCSTPTTEFPRTSVMLQPHEWIASSNPWDTMTKSESVVTKRDDGVKLAVTKPEVFKNIKKEMELVQQSLGELGIFQNKRKERAFVPQPLGRQQVLQHCGSPAPISSLTTLVKGLNSGQQDVPQRTVSLLPERATASAQPKRIKVMRTVTLPHRLALPHQPKDFRCGEPGVMSRKMSVVTPMVRQQHPKISANKELTPITTSISRSDYHQLPDDFDRAPCGYTGVGLVREEKALDRQSALEKCKSLSPSTSEYNRNRDSTEAREVAVQTALSLPNIHQGINKTVSLPEDLDRPIHIELTAPVTHSSVGTVATVTKAFQQPHFSGDAHHGGVSLNSDLPFAGSQIHSERQIQMVENPLTSVSCELTAAPRGLQTVVVQGAAVAVLPHAVSPTHPKKVKVTGTVTLPREFEDVQTRVVAGGSSRGLPSKKRLPGKSCDSTLKGTSRLLVMTRTEDGAKHFHNHSDSKKRSPGKITDSTLKDTSGILVKDMAGLLVMTRTEDGVKHFHNGSDTRGCSGVGVVNQEMHKQIHSENVELLTKPALSQALIVSSVNPRRPTSLMIPHPSIDSTCKNEGRPQESTGNSSSHTSDDHSTPDFLRPLIICENAHDQEQVTSKKKRRKIDSIGEKLATAATVNMTPFASSPIISPLTKPIMCEKIVNDGSVKDSVSGPACKGVECKDGASSPDTDKTSSTITDNSHQVNINKNNKVTVHKEIYIEGEHSIVHDEHVTVPKETTHGTALDEQNIVDDVKKHIVDGTSAIPVTTVSDGTLTCSNTAGKSTVNR